MNERDNAATTAANRRSQHAEGQTAQTGNDEWLRRFQQVYAVGSQRIHDPLFGRVFADARGSCLWDTDGQKWIDLTCGFSASNFGHAYEPLLQAVREQLSGLSHLTAEPHVPGIRLAERLVDILGSPGMHSKVIFNSSGARAIETSLKAACAFRPGKILCLQPGFHGRTIATSAISSTPQSVLSNVFNEQVVSWPQKDYPYCARCPLNLTFPDCDCRCLTSLLNGLVKHHREISCIVLEPALGARGYVFPPPKYFQRLSSIASQYGILTIADEVQTGLGRCGDWLLSRRQAWQPDLVAIGKSLGGGLVPLAAVVGRSEILDSLPSGTESETFAGNPLASAIGLQVIKLLEEQALMERGEIIGQQLRETVATTFREHATFRGFKVEGQGASCALEFRSSQQSSQDSTSQEARQASQFAKACMDQRLRVHLSGPLKTRVVMLPALTMSESESELTQQLLKNAVLEFAAQPLPIGD